MEHDDDARMAASVPVPLWAFALALPVGVLALATLGPAISVAAFTGIVMLVAACVALASSRRRHG